MIKEFSVNQTIEQMQNRASIRSFDPNKKLSPEILEAILKAAQQSPTSISGQQYSVIVIEDDAQKDKMLEFTTFSGGRTQPHVKDCSAFLLFVIDFHKADLILKKENESLDISNSLEGLLVGSVDVGISLEAATVAAESLGLGTVCIGAVRQATAKIIAEFKLPSLTFPIVGLCIGYPLENTKLAPKPRLPFHTFAHKHHYQLENFDLVLDQYNKDLSEFMENPEFKWTATITTYYKSMYNVHLLDLYKKQGFDIC